jgi:Tol biopolymer transport system component
MSQEDLAGHSGNAYFFYTWIAVIACVVVLTSLVQANALTSTKTAPQPPGGTIVFSSVAPRGWDVYLFDVGTKKSQRLTEHPALDYNAAFSPDGQRVAFVSQRDGNHELYVVNRDGTGLKRLTRDFALDDHPAWSPDGKQIAFCSTRQPAKSPGKAWNAVYVMNADGAEVRRISPSDASDYSPAWSPRGDWIACASGSGDWGGTDLYVMKPDGSARKFVVKNGGWPTFSADGAALYFHSQREKQWGIFRVNLDGSGLERITPGEVAAYTPRASADGKWLVAAVRRGQHRQIERIDLATKKHSTITTEAVDHWNPSVSPDGMQILYHRAAADFKVPAVERWGRPPGSTLDMLRVDGVFPAIAPDGKRVALVRSDPDRLDIMTLGGSSPKSVFTANGKNIFSLSWASTGDRIAFTYGVAFQQAKSRLDVEIEVIAPDGTQHKTLTVKAGDNAFPSFSPDSKQLVFRSTRDGEKNLYIMNADGSGVRRLTEGKWTDTQCNWSPTGEWIAFASNRDHDAFALWLIKPDGTGLRKLTDHSGGMNNHPHFSPDGEWIVFASLRAGYSAEDISRLHAGPPGDLFAIRLDGTGLLRLTHDGFGNGVPAWGPTPK